MLSSAQVRDKCLDCQGAAQCRYLADDDQGRFYCIKLTAKRDEIDKEVDGFCKRQLAQGVNPATLGVPLGDNCPGYLFFRHKMQGYDVKP